MAQDGVHWCTLVSREMYLWVPHAAGHFLINWPTFSFSCRTRLCGVRRSCYIADYEFCLFQSPKDGAVHSDVVRGRYGCDVGNNAES